MSSRSKFIVISLFAGCGGSSLGYQMAGGKVLLAVEWDQKAIACYRANFPNTMIFEGDIAKLSGEEALRLTGLNPGELDILDGSPPCQEFQLLASGRSTTSATSFFRSMFACSRFFSRES